LLTLHDGGPLIMTSVRYISLLVELIRYRLLLTVCRLRLSRVIFRWTFYKNTLTLFVLNSIDWQRICGFGEIKTRHPSFYDSKRRYL